MSRPPNGSNGYTNGYYSREASNRYDESHHNGDSIERGRGRGAGGYSGFVEDNLSAQEASEQQNPSLLGAPDSCIYNSSMRSEFGGRGLDHDNSGNRERNTQDSDKSRSYHNGPGSRLIEGQNPRILSGV